MSEKNSDCDFCFRRILDDHRSICAKCRRDPARSPGFIGRVAALHELAKGRAAE